MQFSVVSPGRSLQLLLVSGHTGQMLQLLHRWVVEGPTLHLKCLEHTSPSSRHQRTLSQATHNAAGVNVFYKGDTVLFKFCGQGDDLCLFGFIFRYLKSFELLFKQTTHLFNQHLDSRNVIHPSLEAAYSIPQIRFGLFLALEQVCGWGTLHQRTTRNKAPENKSLRQGRLAAYPSACLAPCPLKCKRMLPWLCLQYVAIDVYFHALEFFVTSAQGGNFTFRM